MLMVDTSVWIDFLADRNSHEVTYLQNSLEAEETICFTGVILQELFQGIRNAKQRHAVEHSFLPFVEVFPMRSTHLLAADLFRKSREAGHPIRSSIDCLIAACSIEQNAMILDKDRDYAFIANVSKLRRFNG